MLGFGRFFRDLREATGPNKGQRPLKVSALIPEVGVALREWIANNKGAKFVLVGGLAYSHYGTPRTTQDIDILFLSAADIPEEVKGFKRIRDHSYQHNKTHVEVEMLTPNHIKMNAKLARQIYDTANIVEGIRIASPSGLVASKLRRLSHYDKGDIENLIAAYEIDLSPFTLTKGQLAGFEKLKAAVEKRA